MSLALPGKKVQALIIIILALFASYFLYKINFKEKFLAVLSGETPTDSLQFAEEVNTVNSDSDTDNDKLKDWQEILWKTDKDNPDTDADGTQDGDEVVEGRDPLIAGPNDKLPETRGVSEASADALSASITDNPDNLSTTLSRSLFAQFMTLDSSGQFAAGSEEEIVSKVISTLDPATIPPQYTISDVKVTDTNKATLRAYGNELAKILIDHQELVSGRKDNSMAILTYQNMIDSVKNISVPGTLGLNHLKMLNNFYTSYQTVVFLNDYKNDPVKALLALKTLQDSTEIGINLSENVASEMKKNGIIFSNEEPGYIWNNY